MITKITQGISIEENNEYKDICMYTLRYAGLDKSGLGALKREKPLRYPRLSCKKEKKR